MQATVQVLLVSCFSVALCFANSDLSLTGTYNKAGNNELCLGDDCSVAPHGPNITIWHGDASCSKLFLYCELDGMKVVLESSPTATDASVIFLGEPPVSDPRIAGREECVTEQRYGDKNEDGMNRALFAAPPAGRLVFSSRHNKCDTNRTIGPDGEEIFTNSVEILEFLKIEGYTSPAVLLVSRTQVAIQCCLNIPPPLEPCVRIPPPQKNLTECTEKDFDLSCAVNSVTEQFVCTVKLRDGQTLGSDKVGFYVDSCDATNPEDVTETENLFNNGKNTDAVLEVCRKTENTGNQDDTEYVIRTPYFQFNSARENTTPKPVTINCAVKIALIADLPQFQGPLGACVAPRFTNDFTGHVGSDSNGLVRSGIVSLLK